MARVVQGAHHLREKSATSSMHKHSRTAPASNASRDTGDSDSMRPDDVEAVPRMPPILALPPELRKSIVEYISRNSDKRNLCLTCKELRDLTMPYLYRHMAVGIRRLSALPNKTHALFEPTHPGLRHVRTLHIITYGHIVSASLLPGVCRLLEAIPKDSLQSFDLSTAVQLPQSLGFLLRLRQRRLQNYQYHSPQPSIVDLLPAADELSHVTSLQFFLRNRTDCKSAGLILEKVQHVRSLDVILNDCLLGFHANDAGAAGLAIINTLFDSGNASRSCPRIRRLRMKELSFKVIGVILPTVLTLDHLVDLELLRCLDTNRLYETLSQLKPPLRVFVDDRLRNARFNDITNTLLKSLAPLKKLRISVDERTAMCEKLGWGALMQHASCLEILEVNDWCINPDLFAGDRALHLLYAFCERALRLQQLAIHCPELESACWQDPQGLNAFLTCLQRLSSLRSLKLTANPQCLIPEDLEEMDDMVEEANDHRFDKVAKRAADKIFESLALYCPSLVAIVIDASDTNSLVRPVGFLRAKQVDLYGKVTYIGVPTKPADLVYNEPSSEIFAESIGYEGIQNIVMP